MIDEKKLIEYIGAGHLRNPEEKVFSENDVVNMINAQPKVGQWIPLKKGLPKEYETVVAVANDYYFVAVYTKEHGFRTRDVGVETLEKCIVDAWMPLPTLYKSKQPSEWKERMMEHFTKGE